MELVFVFLHHLAFLRHNEVLTFRLADEQPAMTQKHRKSSQVELLSEWRDYIHIVCVCVLEANSSLGAQRNTREVKVRAKG